MNENGLFFATQFSTLYATIFFNLQINKVHLASRQADLFALTGLERNTMFPDF